MFLPYEHNTTRLVKIYGLTTLLKIQIMKKKDELRTNLSTCTLIYVKAILEEGVYTY